MQRSGHEIGVRSAGLFIAVARLAIVISRGGAEPDGEAWSLLSDFPGAVLLAQGDRVLVEQAHGFANAAE